MIHNISIATDDDIIQFGDDLNINPVYLSKAIIIWEKCLNRLQKTIVSDYIFCQFLVSWFGNSIMATECTLVNFHWARVPFGPDPLASCGNGSGVDSPTAVSFTVLSQTPRQPSYFQNSIIA